LGSFLQWSLYYEDEVESPGGLINLEMPDLCPLSQIRAKYENNPAEKEYFLQKSRQTNQNWGFTVINK